MRLCLLCCVCVCDDWWVGVIFGIPSRRPVHHQNTPTNTTTGQRPALAGRLIPKTRGALHNTRTKHFGAATAFTLQFNGVPQTIFGDFAARVCVLWFRWIHLFPAKVAWLGQGRKIIIGNKLRGGATRRSSWFSVWGGFLLDPLRTMMEDGTWSEGPEQSDDKRSDKPSTNENMNEEREMNKIKEKIKWKHQHCVAWRAVRLR